MQTVIARHWYAADEAGKLALLKKAKATGFPLDQKLLDTERAEMDRLAAQAGLVPVFVPTVDACGLSTPMAGVVSPAIAHEYRARKAPEFEQATA